MKILAIKTSCEHASVALLIDDDVVERRLDGHVNHSEHLLAVLRALLAEGQLSPGVLDAIAFGAGPGAFTGVRLACGVSQGLAMGAGVGVVPVSSLAALALQGEGERVFAATDARMGEVYSAAYLRQAGGHLAAVQEPECTSPDSLVLPGDAEWFAIGSALRAYESDFRKVFEGRLYGWNADAVPRAADVARLAAQSVRTGAVVAPEQAAPLYVRDKVALTTAERLARGGRA